jgi:hypothetical protein
MTDPISIETSTPFEDRLLFNPGRIVSTPGALAVLEANPYRLFNLLKRHLAGDWGEVPPEDAQSNQDALATGARLLSSYPQPCGARIWIITEADRSVTTVLLPEEY